MPATGVRARDAGAGRMSNAAAVTTRELTRVFATRDSEVHALGPLNVSIEAGEFVCVVGPSGCGKSTLVKMIAGLLSPTEGSIEILTPGGTPPTISTVFQDFGIFPWKSVRENVALALRAQGVDRSTARTEAEHWLARMGLAGFGSAYPTTLSGGMKQRVAIARALAPEPDLILMDEPFASLDAQLRQLLQEELLALAQTNARRTVIFVTHSLEEAILLGDRVIVMSSRPGTIVDECVVPFGRPRDGSVRESAEFSALRGRLWDHLRDQVTLPKSGEGSDA